MPDIRDFGHLVEGVVEQDPMSDRYVIRTQLDDGSVRVFDPQEALGKYVGREVRFTLATFDTLNEIAAFLEQSQTQDPSQKS